MKKTSIVGIAARLAASIALMSSTALTAQSIVFGTIADDNEPDGLDDLFLKMHKQFDKTNHIARVLIDKIVDEKLVDPVSAYNFDFRAVGAQMFAAGRIADMKIWTDAASTIEAKGFAAYVDQVVVRMSMVDKLVTVTGAKVKHWATLSEDDRTAAVMKNSDENIIPALAQLQASVVNLQNYAMVGVLVFEQLSYIDNKTGLLVPTDAAAAKKLETVDA
jgi:hypothetical protein